MNYVCAVAIQSAGLATASSGLRRVRPVIGQQPDPSVMAAPEHSLFIESSPSRAWKPVLNHCVVTRPHGYSLSHPVFRPARFHSIPITKVHVAV